MLGNAEIMEHTRKPIDESDVVPNVCKLAYLIVYNEFFKVYFLWYREPIFIERNLLQLLFTSVFFTWYWTMHIYIIGTTTHTGPRSCSEHSTALHAFLTAPPQISEIDTL